MTELVFFLEEESAKVLLEIILPRLAPPERVASRFVVFEGKQDLDRQLPRKLRGYLNPKARFLVLRDQDAADCRDVKRALIKGCSDAGHPGAVVRIACRELETFYLGDLAAVERGLNIAKLSAKQDKAKFRTPDGLHSPSIELEKLTGRRYQKVNGSRAIAPHLDLDNARSRSFHHLVQAIRRLAN